MSGPVWSVIRREYLQRVRNRWFIVTTLGFPVLLLGLTLLPALLGQRDARRERHIAVVDRTGVLFERMAGRLAEAGYTLDTLPAGVRTEDLNPRVLDGDLGAYLLVDEQTLIDGTAYYVAGSRPSDLRRFTIREIVARAALEAELERNAVRSEVAFVLDDAALDVQTLGGEALEDEEGAFLRAFMGTFFLYFVIFFYGVAVLRSVLEEKTGRIVEVIVSSMKPRQLMLGKVLGVGAVGLTQLTVWILSALVVLGLAIPNLIAFLPEGVEPRDLQRFLPDVGLLLAFALLFLLGYFLYAALFAAVGAMCSTEEEAQQAQFPVIMLLVIPFVLVSPAIQNGGSALWIGLSLFPFFSPILMYARVAAGLAAPWELAVAAVLMTAAIWAVAWVAGRIYKVGILMQGKRPTLPELVRWVREA